MYSSQYTSEKLEQKPESQENLLNPVLLVMVRKMWPPFMDHSIELQIHTVQDNGLFLLLHISRKKCDIQTRFSLF
jgi:hypothetical protein